ncbi:MAG: bifunctional 4-hydroxy-3-methylbut-2-enyl diphosphate reductase/30S ribosomal protein S1, partial [Candidatus Calescibacterium sp.]
GKMSSNTEKLYKVCKEIVESHKIETADELELSWISGKEKIGIVAGTSTPDWVISDVIKKIKDLSESKKIQIIRVGKKNKFSVEVANWDV